MIPSDWFVRKLTVQEVESMTRAEVLGLDESRIVDRDPIHKMRYFDDHAYWKRMKSKMQPGDTLQLYEARGHRWVSMGSTRGIALVRDGETIDVVILPPRVNV